MDFACHEQRLIIEVEGSQHAAQVAYDDARTSWLTSSGYRVMRFWNDDVLRDTDAVLEAIAQVVSDGEASPFPSPLAGADAFPVPSPLAGEG